MIFRAAVISIVMGLSVLSTHASEWKFVEGEEDWGRTCFASIEVDGVGTVGFMGAPGTALVAYVDADLEAPAIEAKWQLEGMSWTADAERSDYFGWHEFYELPIDFMEAVGAGDELDVAIEGGVTIHVPLTGSAKAVAAVLDCYRN